MNHTRPREHSFAHFRVRRRLLEGEPRDMPKLSTPDRRRVRRRLASSLTVR